MGRYEGKTAVITGGTTGIGFATARLLASEGAKVLVTGRTPRTAEAAGKELGNNGRAILSDAAKLEDIDRLAASAKDYLGHVDFLFVNAGVASFSPFEQVDSQKWDEIIGINLKGAFFTIQRILPLLQSGSAIVLNTTALTEIGMSGTSVYSASKAALRSLGRTLATELVSRGVRVNVVSPGPIETPILEKAGFDEATLRGFMTEIQKTNPMKRTGLPEEVARAALYLAFEATYTTGADLPVDGGTTQL